MHRDESDEDNEKVDEKLTIKRRYQNPSKLMHHKKQQPMRRNGRRKRHPSLNDPPSYDAVMEYPNGSSDESDGEETNQKKHVDSVQSMVEKCHRNKHFVESSRSFGEQNSYQSRDLYSFNPLALQTLPVAHSDGELNVRSPRYVVHNIPPRGFVNPLERAEDDYNENKDRMFDKIMNSKDSLVHVERSKSPITRDERHRTTPVQMERTASVHSDHSRSSIRSDRARTPNSFERTKSPTHYERSKTPNHYERGKSPANIERAKSPSHLYARAKKPPRDRTVSPVIPPPQLYTSEQNNLDDSSGYLHLKAAAGPPIEKLSPLDQVDVGQSNPMDIPLTTFTGSLKKKRHKSKQDMPGIKNVIRERPFNF
jgi:hypothetical protein